MRDRRSPPNATSPGGRTPRALALAAMLALAVGPPPGGVRVVNASGGAIWVRPEHTVQPVRVAAGAAFGGVDALAQPGARPGRIYKVADYCSVLVDAAGRVRPICQGLLSEVVQLAEGGWKDEAWRRVQITVHYDHDWDPLFARSRPRGARPPPSRAGAMLDPTATVGEGEGSTL